MAKTADLGRLLAHTLFRYVSLSRTLTLSAYSGLNEWQQ